MGQNNSKDNSRCKSNAITNTTKHATANATKNTTANAIENTPKNATQDAIANTMAENKTSIKYYRQEMQQTKI